MSFGNLSLLDKQYVYEINPNTQFSVVECKAGGEGKCFFISTNPVLFIKAKDQAPVVWSLKNKKCAEAAFLVKDERGNIHLHIVEMKSSLNLGEFNKVLEQLKGMFLSAIAVLGILKLPEPETVTTYLAFKKDKISEIDSAQPILLKLQVGGARMPGMNEWITGRINLEHGVLAPLVKGKRNPHDFDFGTI